ncbi:MAG: twin-arginine translocase subunit TatC [Dehalococcoidia bacterium]|nr:twin-arginine translocase subunit TatC [Dehalococcoidia bacterium]
MSAAQQPQPPHLQPVEPQHPGEMTLLEHLKELRDRVMWAGIAVVLGMLICGIFWETILGWLLAPAREHDDSFQLNSFSPFDRISALMRIAFYGGLVLASPMVVYQLLAFVTPGLTSKEKRILFPGLFATIAFLLGGMAFAYWIVLPNSLTFLLSLGDDKIEDEIGIMQYVGFVTRLIVGIGLAFELPVVMAIMAKLGLVRAKRMLGFWRYSIIIIAVIAAVVTPTPDPVNMALVMGPLFFLYFVGILFAWAVQPRRPREAAV